MMNVISTRAGSLDRAPAPQGTTPPARRLESRAGFDDVLATSIARRPAASRSREPRSDEGMPGSGARDSKTSSSPDRSCVDDATKPSPRNGARAAVTPSNAEHVGTEHPATRRRRAADDEGAASRIDADHKKDATEGQIVASDSLVVPIIAKAADTALTLAPTDTTGGTEDVQPGAIHPGQTDAAGATDVPLAPGAPTQERASRSDPDLVLAAAAGNAKPFAAGMAGVAASGADGALEPSTEPLDAASQAIGDPQQAGTQRRTAMNQVAGTATRPDGAAGRAQTPDAQMLQAAMTQTAVSQAAASQAAAPGTHMAASNGSAAVSAEDRAQAADHRWPGFQMPGAWATDTTVAADARAAFSQAFGQGEGSGPGDAHGGSTDGSSRPSAAAASHAPMPIFALPADGPAAVASTAVAAVMPSAPTSADDAENVTALIQTMRISSKSGVWEATVRLKPDHMGEVTISLTVDRGSVSAVVHAESAGVREWLLAHEGQVRSGLNEQGLHLARFAVEPDEQRHGETTKDASPRRQPRRPRPAANRFEVTV